MPPQRRRSAGAAGLVAVGTGVALAVALPAALAAQVVDAVGDGDAPSAVTYPLAAVVLVGAGAGGWVVGNRADRRGPVLGALSALAAVALVQAVGVARRLAADDEVRWAPIPAVLVLAMLVGAGAAVLAIRRAGRTRP